MNTNQYIIWENLKVLQNNHPPENKVLYDISYKMMYTIAIYHMIIPTEEIWEINILKLISIQE